jgi:polyisoprenoid-binding protein YceI
MKNVRMTGLAAVMALAAMALTLNAGALHAQVKDYKIDAAHSEADFAIKHLAISTVHGSFRGLSGVVHFDPSDMAKSGVEASIDVATVDTGVTARDGHLKSGDFFDTAKFPTMTFKSTSVVKSGSGYKVTGDLTLHGVTKSVVLNMEEPSKAQPDGKGVPHRGFTATTTINRKDFGLLWENKTSGGDAILSDDVKIELDIEAAQV